MSFNQDLQFGEKGEQMILKMLQKQFPLAHKVDYRVANFDLYVPEIDIAIEVKWDRQTWRTGNIAIEFEYKGKPSGIATSHADYWVILFDIEDELYSWKIKRSDLLKVVNQYKRFWSGGDAKASQCYFLNIEELEKCKLFNAKLLKEVPD